LTRGSTCKVPAHSVRRGPLSGVVPSGVSPWRTTVGVGCGRVFTRPTSFRRPSSSPGARIFRSGPWSRTFRFEAFGRRPRGRDLGAGTARGGRAWFSVPPEGGSGRSRSAPTVMSLLRGPSRPEHRRQRCTSSWDPVEHFRIRPDLAAASHPGPGARVFRSGSWSRTFRCEAFGHRPRWS
jgi:hypothetical protein